MADGGGSDGGVVGHTSIGGVPVLSFYSNVALLLLLVSRKHPFPQKLDSSSALHMDPIKATITANALHGMMQVCVTHRAGPTTTCMLVAGDGHSVIRTCMTQLRLPTKCKDCFGSHLIRGNGAATISAHGTGHHLQWTSSHSHNRLMLLHGWRHPRDCILCCVCDLSNPGCSSDCLFPRSWSGVKRKQPKT